MNGELLAKNGRCSACGGRVRNSASKRLTRKKLAERHAEACPGLARRDSRSGSQD